VVETKTVEVTGGHSEKVSFSITKDIAGTYTLNVDGLSGTFEVKAPPVPVAFTTSALSISPTEVDIGENIIVSVVVANTGNLPGTYKVTLKVGNVVVETKEVTVAGGDSEPVSFNITKDTAGVYQVNVDGLSGTFEVKEAAPPSPSLVEAINWPALGGVIAGVIAAGLLIFFLARRRTY